MAEGNSLAQPRRRLAIIASILAVVGINTYSGFEIKKEAVDFVGAFSKQHETARIEEDRLNRAARDVEVSQQTAINTFLQASDERQNLLNRANGDLQRITLYIALSVSAAVFGGLMVVWLSRSPSWH